MTSTWTEEDLTRDGFLGGRLQLLQPRRGYRAGTDPVYLAAAVPARPGQTVLELGTGAGAALLCLGSRVPHLSLVGLELQADYAELARRNADHAGIPAEIVDGDLLRMPACLKSQRFDHVIMNPPYFRGTSRTRAPDPGRELARGDTTPLSDWIDAALRRLAPKGRLTLIQDVRRLPEVMAMLHDRAGTIGIQPLAPRPGRTANRVIVTAQRGGASVMLASPQVIHRRDEHVAHGDDYTPEARAVLRDGAAWPWIEN